MEPPTDPRAANLPWEVSIVVADDHLAFRASAVRWLGTVAGVGLVRGAAANAAALRELAALRTDLLLLGLGFDEPIDGEHVRRLKAQAAAARVVAMAVFPSPAREAAVRAAGADGLLAKESIGDALPRLLHALFGPAHGRESARTKGASA